MEVLLNMERLLLGSEWGQLRMRHELFKIAELVSLLVFHGVDLILILFDAEVLLVISLKEWINSLDVFLFKEFWEIEHHHFLVFNAVDFEYIVQHKLYSLV